MKIRNYVFLLVGAGFVMTHVLTVQGLFAGSETWNTPLLLVVNLILDLPAMGFLAAGVYPLCRRFCGELTFSRVAILIACAAMLAALTTEILVNNSHRDVFVRDLHSPDSRIRAEAARQLASTGYNGAIPDLAEALRDSDPTTRLWAARALGASESRTAAKPLADALRDPDGAVQLAAVAALEKLWDMRKEASFIPALARFIEAEDACTQLEKALALCFLSPVNSPECRAASVEFERLETPARGAAATRRAVVRLLMKIDDSRAVPALARSVQRYDLVTIAAAPPFFIARGEKGSEAVLMLALDRHGSTEMAEAFLNSGNPKLEAGARDWAQKRGLTIGTGSARFGPARWGGSRN